jgi:hypothetical protein
MGQWSGLWTECEEKLCLEPISDVGCSSVSSSCLTVFIKLRRFSGAVKPQLVWSMTTGRQVSTPMVLEPSDLFGREGEPL